MLSEVFSHAIVWLHTTSGHSVAVVMAKLTYQFLLGNWIRLPIIQSQSPIRCSSVTPVRNVDVL
jgi:hypothetical protein